LIYLIFCNGYILKVVALDDEIASVGEQFVYNSVRSRVSVICTIQSNYSTVSNPE